MMAPSQSSTGFGKAPALRWVSLRHGSIAASDALSPRQDLPEMRATNFVKNFAFSSSAAISYRDTIEPMDDDPDLDYRALLDFRYAIRSFLHFSEESARAAGIEPQQHQLMLAIKAGSSDGEARIGDLAELLKLRHHSTVELIDRLVANGFAERQRAETDRRQVHVRLTEAGERVLHQLSERHSEQLRSNGPELLRVLEGITKSESMKRERHAANDSPVSAR